MDEQVWVQSVAVTMKLPSGEVVTGKFTGLAICSPGDWGELTARESLADALHGDTPIIFTSPTPLDKLISSDSDQHDMIDSIRAELRREHHDKLSE